MQKYTISIHPEDLKGHTVYVGVVEENDVSSFGDTPEEALNMTIDALGGILIVEEKMNEEIREKQIMKAITGSIKKTTDSTYSVSIPSYATHLQMNRNSKDSKDTLMAA